jgi:nicotinic acid mononucleotide adenylyltransferase
MSRTLKGKNGTNLGLKSIENYIKSRISKGYAFSAAQSSYIHKKKQPVFVFEVTSVDISSTMIRKHVKNGNSVKHLVPEIIDDYIKAKGLYL